MEIIPSIDLKGGTCVRLRQGREEDAREYSTDPVAIARRWVSQGARRLHVVNLDGAFGRKSANLEVLRSIAAEKDVAVQYGGGLRSREVIDAAFDAGAARVVLGTAAILGAGLLEETLLRYGSGRVTVALDTLEGRLAVKGWTEITDRPLLAVAAELKKSGVEEILQTDILRDGMMTGPDVQTLAQLAETGLSIIASGGISSLEHIRALLALGRTNITGAIVGKALYEGAVELPDLIAAAALV